MQVQQGMSRSPGRRPTSGALLRAIRYLGNQRQTVLVAYGSLVVATLAQLAVPQLVQNMIDAVTRSVVATRILTEVPAAFQAAAAARLGLTIEELQRNAAHAEEIVINAALLILVFAVIAESFRFYSRSWLSEPRMV